MKQPTKVLRNLTLAAFDDPTQQSYSLKSNQDILLDGKYILAITDSKDPDAYNCPTIDCQGALVTPGLIDCHTHLVFGGNRAAEWEQRLNGVPYTEIAQQGGGINSSVQATREQSAQQLYAQATKRLQSFLDEGVTTIEIKSGYGLNLDAERKTLEVAKQLANNFPVEVVGTLLSAHTVPSEYKTNPQAYLDLVCQEIIPTMAQQHPDLFEAVDVFTETVGFSLEQSEQVFKTAQNYGYRVKGHTEQLSNLGGSALVAKYQGLSVDHIEYLDQDGVAAIKEANVVAVLLPTAYYFLRETQKPPVDLLRKYKVPIAVASDFNPGTAPFTSLRIAMNFSCVLFGLTPLEAWYGVTVNAAQALNRATTHGKIAPGYIANLAIWDAKNPVEIVYELNSKLLKSRVFEGELV